MKKILFILLLVSGFAYGQAPEKMSYQAVARDISGNPLMSSAVNLQFDILQGSATGTVTYSETQSKTTNQFGLFTAEIGSGSVVSGTFSSIGWGTNPYYLRITVNGDVMPATQLLSVPYALYSKTSGGAGAALTAGSGIDITGGVITSTLDTSLTNEFQDLSWNTTDSNIIDISNGTGIPLASNTPALDQVLTWNGTNWIAQDIGGSWTQGTGNDIYNNTDSVGIGTTDPKSLLQLGDFMHLSPAVVSSTEKYALTSYNSYWDGTTLRNTTGGISGTSFMGDDGGIPVMSWMLFPTQAAGTDMFSATPSLRMNLRSKGLAINSDAAAAGLEVSSLDSASIFMDIPDDNSQPTLSYRAPGGSSEILSLRVPNTLTNSYTLTYPTDLPTAAGSSLVSDLSGNLSWSTPAASPWTGSLNLIYPTTLTDKVGIGMNSPAAKLDVLSTLTENSTVTTQIVNQNNAASNFRTLYVDAQSSGTAVEYAAGDFVATGPGAIGNSIGFRSSATGGATNWAGYFGAGNVYIQNNLGIGTTGPTARLHSNGTLRLENLGGTAPASGSVLTAIDANGNAQWQTSSSAFATSGNVTSNSPGDYTTDDFVFGSPQLDGNGVTGNHSRMFFDKSKSSFRAGSSINASWNDANVGAYSVAFGNSTTASGTGSHASGTNSIASGDYSFSHGSNLTATGLFSFVSGTASQAAGTGAVVFGNGNAGNGVYSMTTGTQNTSESYTQLTVGSFATIQTGSQFSAVGTDRAFVIGNGISLATRSDAFTILKNGTAFLNGTLTIDADNVAGAGNSYTLPGQDGAANQVLTTNGSGVTSWQTPTSVTSFWNGSAGVVYPATLTDNVGVGISAPSSKFHVYNNANVESTLESNAGLADFNIDAAVNRADIVFKRSGATEGSMGYNLTNDYLFLNDGVESLVSRNGRIGIGTNTPGMLPGATNYLTISSIGPYATGSVASLELKGNTNMANDAASKIDFLNGIGGPNNIARIEARTSGGNTAQGQLAFYTNDGTLNERMRITTGGNVGIGTTNPSALLSVNGAANKPGGGAWTVFSDARSKENVVNYNKGLNELLELRPVSFNYKKEFNWGTKTYVGLIAQEVEKVVPTMVETKEVNGIKDFREVDPNEINYMLINAIKEQQKMIEKLQLEIDALKK